MLLPGRTRRNFTPEGEGATAITQSELGLIAPLFSAIVGQEVVELGQGRREGEGLYWGSSCTYQWPTRIGDLVVVLCILCFPMTVIGVCALSCPLSWPSRICCIFFCPFLWDEGESVNSCVVLCCCLVSLKPLHNPDLFRKLGILQFWLFNNACLILFSTELLKWKWHIMVTWYCVTFTYSLV